LGKYPNTPAEIFKVIDNQSVNRVQGENLIERYGNLRVKEALADIQRKMRIEVNEEVDRRIKNIGKLLDELYEKMETPISSISRSGV
jgi:hypothetical protein